MNATATPAGVFPLLVVVPVRSADEANPLFLEALGEQTVLDWTLADAEELSALGPVHMIVTSDDPRILEHARSRGRGWMTRRREARELERGYFTSIATAAEVAEAEVGEPFGAALVLEPSHPFRPEGLIANAIDIFARGGDLDTVVAVVREYGNLWTEGSHGGLTRMRTPEGRNFFREVAGLCLLTRPAALSDTSAMGEDVGFVVIEEQWAMIDLHGPDGVSLARRFQDLLKPGG